MAEETNKKSIEKKPKPKKKKGKIDTLSIIFFAIMVIGLIVLTVIVLTKPTSKIYSTQYGENFTVSVELYSNNKIDLTVDVKDDRVIQSGNYKEITDDEIENNYTAEFINEETNEKTTVELLLINDELKLTYSDGTEIILKEINND